MLTFCKVLLFLVYHKTLTSRMSKVHTHSLTHGKEYEIGKEIQKEHEYNYKG